MHAFRLINTNDQHFRLLHARHDIVAALRALVDGVFVPEAHVHSHVVATPHLRDHVRRMSADTPGCLAT